MKTLTALIVSKGLNPTDFTAEIQATRDEVGFTRKDIVASHFGEHFRDGYDGIGDAMIVDTRKFFVWFHNQQNGSDAMDYWWSVREFKDGKWKTLFEKRYRGSDRYNTDRYTKTFRDVLELYPNLLKSLK